MGVVPGAARPVSAITVAALLWMSFACVRVVTPPAVDPTQPPVTNPLALGQGCAQDAACASGHCVDGVCCVSACVGVCTTCAQPGSIGRCVLAQDNSDPREDCDACYACFSGSCGPSPGGTAPKNECGDTQACNGLGACAAAFGEACTLDTVGCASGACILAQCTSVREQRLPRAFDDATFERPLSVMHSARGVALLTNPQVAAPYTLWDDNGCPSQEVLRSVDVLRFQIIRPDGVQQQVFNPREATYPAALVETSAGHEMVFARACGGVLCGLSIMGVPGGTALPILDDPGSPAWVAAVALPDDRTVVGVQGIFTENFVTLASRQALGGRWVTAGLGFKDVTFDGPRWAVASGRPWLVGIMEEPEQQFFAASLDTEGQTTVVRSAAVVPCSASGIPPLVSAVAVDGVVHVVEVCNVGEASGVIHAVLQDAGSPGATFSPLEVLQVEPPLPRNAAGAMLVAREAQLALVFTDGPTLRVAWPDDAGIWRHQKVTQVGDGEMDVGYFHGSQTGRNAVVAWSPGHDVYSVVGSQLCGDSELPLFQSWLAVTQLSL
jgi:hypothetical protein